MPQQYPGSPILGLRGQEALIRALIWAFIGVLYGMLFVFLAELADEWKLPVNPIFFSGVLSAAVAALIYSSMRLAVLLAILISPVCLMFYVFTAHISHPNDLLVPLLPAGAVIGGLYGQLSKASRVHRADAKTLAGLSAGFLVALLYLTLSHLLKDLPIGFVVGIMCPLTGFLYVLFVPTFIRFHDDLLPASLDGAMVGAGVAVFLAYVFFVMTNSIDNGPLGSATPLIANLDELLPQAVLGGALGAGVIGLLSGLLLTNWQDL